VSDQTAAVDTLARDSRHALRRLRRDWPFTVAAILILGLGIGANTAVFSLINAALFRGQMLADPDRLVDIYQNASNPGGLDGNSYPAYLDMAEYTDVFASTTAVSVPLGVNYLQDGGLRPATVEYTTATYLSVLGLRPAIGRWFSAGEDRGGGPIVGVLSHQAWTRKFGGDRSVVGRTIRIDGAPVTIVGVGPVGHNATLKVGIVTDFWLPIASLPALGAPPDALARRPAESAFFVKARLRDGVTVAQAQAAMTILGKRLAAEYPKEDSGKGITVYAASAVRVHPQLDVGLRWVALVLLGVVGLVLALACSNLATLVLVRGASRAKEVSIRLALGATRTQIVRHLLMESLLLSASGGAAGAVLAWWAIRLFGRLDLPIVVDLSLDYRVLAFAAGLSILTGIAFGLAPALSATRTDLVPALRDDAGTRSAEQRWFTLKNALVVLQVTASVVLLGGTCIFLRTIDAIRAQRAGFAVDGIAMLQTDMRYANGSAAEARNIAEAFRRRVAAIPGVESAVLTRDLPMGVTGTRIVVGAEGTGPAVEAGAIWASPGYFELLRIPILFGRSIDVRDRRDTPRVAVISEAMARQYFGRADAVGRRFRIEQDVSDWFEIVGVAANTGTADPGGDLVDPQPYLFYRSFTQFDPPPNTLVARTSLDATSLVGLMQRELRAVNAALPVMTAKTMAQKLEDSEFAPRTIASLLAGLGALGMTLAGVGLYAVVALRVSQRAREIGIRMALGARSPQVVWAVTRQVGALVGVGTGLGLVLSLGAVGALRAVSAPAVGFTAYRPTADPIALVAIAAFMTAVGLAAASVPSWRAARMDPLKALRRD